MCVNTSHTCAGRFDMWGSCRWHTAEGFLRRRIRMDAGRHQTVQRWNWCLSTACHWSSSNGAPQAHPGQELQTDPSLSETESTDNEKWETILFAKKWMKTVKLSNNVSFVTKWPHYHVGDHVGDHDESFIQNCRGFGEEQLPGLPRVSHVAGQLAHQELGQVLCSESWEL